jgi:hypothetical protein
MFFCSWKCLCQLKNFHGSAHRILKYSQIFIAFYFFIHFASPSSGKLRLVIRGENISRLVDRRLTAALTALSIF